MKSFLSFINIDFLVKKIQLKTENDCLSISVSFNNNI